MAIITDISILYVEDQEEIRNSLSRILSRKYRDVFLASNGIEGIEAFKKHNPQIVITDIRMPLMDGLGMSKKLKEINKDVFIILTTAHTDLDYFHESINIGINQYILKPIDNEKLFQSIEKCTNEIYKSRELAEKNRLLSIANLHLKKREEELERLLDKTNTLKESIAENEQKFQQLAGHIDDVFWLKSPEKYLYINNSFEKVFGILKEDILCEPHLISSIIHPEDFDFFNTNYIQKEFSNSKGINIEFRICRPDDSIRWIWLRSFPVFSVAGNNNRIAGIASDITEKKELELKQEQNNKWLDTTLSSINDGVITTNIKAEVLYMNKAAKKLLHIKKDDIIGVLSTDLFSIENEKDEKKGEHPVDYVLEKGKAYYSPDFSALKPSKGKKFPVECNAVPLILENNDCVGVVVTFRDISVERKKRIELKVKNLALETSTNGIAITDFKGKITFANHGFLQMWGFDNISDILKTDISSLFVDSSQFNNILREKKHGWTGEIIARKADFSQFHVLGSVSIVADDDNQPLCFMASFINITEKIQLEKIQKKLEIAEQTAKTKQQFLSNISNEMRSPLNGIKAITEFLLKTPLTDLQKDYSLTIKNSADNLIHLFNDVLDLTRIEAGTIDFKPIVFNVFQTHVYVVRLFESHIRNKNIEFKYHFQNNFPPIIKADEKRVSQVYMNLISNAVKFTDSGYISSNFSYEIINNNQIRVKIEVADTGIGISEEHQKTLFNKFFQTTEPNTNKFDGAGLGLAICKELSELMGGGIGASSKIGQGSRFWFTFIAEVAKESEILQNKDDLSAFNSLKLDAKVLYAEDKFVNQKLLSLILENAGCKIDIAENGQKAIEMYSEKKYDLIFMDIQMPIMDGVTATQQLRNKFKKLPPIIGLSANVLGNDAERYIKLGLDDYIAKPIKPEVIFEKMLKWLQPAEYINRISNMVEKHEIVSQPNEFLHQNIIDEDTLKSISGQTMGNQPLINQLYESFIADSDELIKSLTNASIDNDITAFKSGTHAIKGLAGTVGATSLFQKATVMDKLLKNNQIEESIQLFPALAELYQEARDYIITHIIKD